nr:MAG: serine/threonine protein phosphatase [Thermoproteus sp. AZ2]
MKLLELVAEAADKFSRNGLVLNINEDELVIVGDLHGDIETLEQILKRWNKKILFLGDYVDRGTHGVEVLETALGLYLEGRAYMLRGNHESAIMNKEEGFLDELCLLKQMPNCLEIYRNIENMFAKMPLAAVVNGSIFAVHGGIPLREPSMEPAPIEDLRRASDLAMPADPIAWQALWNDPCECETYRPSPRGFGIWLFGRRPTEAFLKREGLRRIVRGHLYVESGYAVHLGVVHTVFSSKAGPYKHARPKVALLSGGAMSIIDIYTGEEVAEVRL